MPDKSTFIRALVAGCALLAAGIAPAAAQERPHGRNAHSEPIEGQYIVVLKQGASTPDTHAQRARQRGGRVHHVYSRAVRGFAASLTPQQLEEMRNDPDVELIEQDHTVSIAEMQAQATWGLDRVDQVDRPLDTVYNYTLTGQGVYAFILDTGILSTHSEFTGRMGTGYTVIADGKGTEDCNGHGTHVAGTVGGTTWGVAKQVTLVPVRVLGCTGSGSWSGVIAGIDWVANGALRPAVINMSLGGGKSTSLNAAVEGAIAKGVTVVVAAGNNGAIACNYSPASAPSAITVGATTSADSRATYSNYGSCVDIFAPGSSITSAWYTGATATNTINGTSMATPHVAGAAALVLQANPGATPLAVTTFLKANASAGKVASAGVGSPNLLLYAAATGLAQEPVKPVIAVSGLSGTATEAGRRNWNATVTTSVRNVVTGQAMANVSVKGTFAPGGTYHCVTAASGSCTITKTLGRTEASTKFTVNSLSGTDMTYDATQNTATQLILSRP